MQHHVTPSEITGAVTSTTALGYSYIAPHPLQIVAWCVAILAGLFTIYRAVRAELDSRKK